MSGLAIAKGLSLDPDYVGSGTFALLAKRGAGKTYTARVMAEEFWKAHVPFVALDPMGASWGLRASEDGKSAGIPVAIFGGKHADAPLERTGGAVMADLVVDDGLSMVLDMSELGSRTAERQFAEEFLERLYRRNDQLVHLLMDEADLFAPQKPQAGDQKLLGIAENIVRRGRNRGIGITLISQRPAVLNKDVLTQVDGLAILRVTGKTDRDAINAWVSGHGDDDHAREVKESLSGLENGECWWWIPELGILDRVRIRRARTFDSSPNRKRGEQRRAPKTFADVDMAAIGEKMADTIERAKQTDPKELQRTIRDLRRQLEQRPSETTEVEVVKEVEVPVLTDDARQALEDAVETLGGSASKVIAAANEIAGDLGKLNRRPPAAAPAVQPRPSAKPSPAPRSQRASLAVGALTPARLRILNALAALEAIGVAAAAKTQLALFAEASPKSSGYANNLGGLRTAGLIDYPAGGQVQLTPEGREIADATTAPATHEELMVFVRGLVGPAKARIIDALVSVYPDALSKGELADRADASPNSSGYANNLGALRSLKLIDYPTPGHVVAQPVLFLEAAA